MLTIPAFEGLNSRATFSEHLPQMAGHKPWSPAHDLMWGHGEEGLVVTVPSPHSRRTTYGSTSGSLQFARCWGQCWHLEKGGVCGASRRGHTRRWCQLLTCNGAAAPPAGWWSQLPEDWCCCTRLERRRGRHQSPGLLTSRGFWLFTRRMERAHEATPRVFSSSKFYSPNLDLRMFTAKTDLK